MIYTVYFSDVGAPKTGLFPSIDVYIKVSDGSSPGGAPAVSELSGGFYKFTGAPAEPMLCRIDSNDVAMANSDRYKVVLITPDDPALTEARMAELDPANIPADADTLIARLTAARAGYLDNLSAGPAALEATLTAIKGAGWVDENLTAIQAIVTANWGGIGAVAASMALEATLTAMKGAGWTDESLKAIKDAIDAHAGGIGSRTVIITTQDGAGVPITDAQVEVWNAGATAIITWGQSNSVGQIQRALDDGSYKVKMRKAGWAFDIETLAVAGNTSATYTGTSTLPAAPALPTICRVYEYCFMPDGATPMASVDAKARIVSLPEDTGAMILTGQLVDAVYAAASGLVYWDVPQGSKVEFTIQDFGIRVTKTIPATATARLSDIA